MLNTNSTSLACAPNYESEFSVDYRGLPAFASLSMAGSGGIWKSINSGFLLVFGFCLGFLPWLIRNLIVGAPLLSVSSRGKIVFVQSNEAQALEGGAYFVSTSETAADILNNANGSVISIINGVWSGYEGDLGLLLSNWTKKFMSLWERWEIYDNTSLYLFQEVTQFVKFYPGFGLVFPMGVSGLLLLIFHMKRKTLQVQHDSGNADKFSNLQKDAHKIFIFSFLVFVAAMSLTHVTGRQRIYLAPFLIVYTGVFFDLFIGYLRRKELKAILVAALFVICASTFQSLYSRIPWLGLTPLSHYLVALDLAIEKKEFGLADQIVKNAQQIYPDYFKIKLKK
ncbi:hypothetical protein ACFL17_08160 [Pseudomonadota bacterium]